MNFMLKLLNGSRRWKYLKSKLKKCKIWLMMCKIKLLKMKI